MRTIIGQGSALQGTGKVHGAPLGKTDLANVKTLYGFDPNESFVVPPDVREVYASKGRKGAELEASWNSKMGFYATEHAELAAEFNRRVTGTIPEDLRSRLPVYSSNEPKAAATRNRSEEVSTGALSRH